MSKRKDWGTTRFTIVDKDLFYSLSPMKYYKDGLITKSELELLSSKPDELTKEQMKQAVNLTLEMGVQYGALAIIEEN